MMQAIPMGLVCQCLLANQAAPIQLRSCPEIPQQLLPMYLTVRLLAMVTSTNQMAIQAQTPNLDLDLRQQMELAVPCTVDPRFHQGEEYCLGVGLVICEPQFCWVQQWQHLRIHLCFVPWFWRRRSKIVELTTPFWLQKVSTPMTTPKLSL